MELHEYIDDWADKYLMPVMFLCVLVVATILWARTILSWFGIYFFE